MLKINQIPADKPAKFKDILGGENPSVDDRLKMKRFIMKGLVKQIGKKKFARYIRIDDRETENLAQPDSKITLDFLDKINYDTPISFKDIAAKLGLSGPTPEMRLFLHKYIDDGLITKIGCGKNTKYLRLKIEDQTDTLFPVVQEIDDVNLTENDSVSIKPNNIIKPIHKPKESIEDWKILDPSDLFAKELTIKDVSFRTEILKLVKQFKPNPIIELGHNIFVSNEKYFSDKRISKIDIWNAISDLGVLGEITVWKKPCKNGYDHVYGIG